MEILHAVIFLELYRPVLVANSGNSESASTSF